MSVATQRPVLLSWPGRQRGPAVARAAVPPRSHRSEAPDAAPPLLAYRGGAGELHHGDNLAVLRALAEKHAGTVTLAYLDPPFFTGRVHRAVDRGRLAGEREERDAFDDRWCDRAAYLEALAPRLVAVRELLAAHGSAVVHVDPKTSHYVKVLCDEIFGDECFASEIVWRYRRWPSKTQNFQRVHDVLLRYRKDAATAPRWTTLYEPLATSTLATWGTGKQRAVVEDGRRARSSTTAEPTRGVPLGDVWEIGVIAPVARERTGYPTQKPEALLERLVDALTLPDDVVLDPYAGSGTSLAVAARRGRRFIGIDASDVAVGIARARLETLGDRAYPRVQRSP